VNLETRLHWSVVGQNNRFYEYGKENANSIIEVFFEQLNNYKISGEPP